MTSTALVNKWRVIAAAAVLCAVLAGVVIWWARVVSDFWPLDKSSVGPNIIASVICWAVLFVGATLLYPPLRRAIRAAADDLLHQHFERHRAITQDRHDESVGLHEEVLRHLRHIIDSHPDIPPIPPKEPTVTTSTTPLGFKKGLLPFDPEKHARFKTLADYGFTLPSPSYPIDKSSGNRVWGMDGNGPDPTLTVNGGQPVGDCGVAAVPAHSNMLIALLLALDLAQNTMTSDQVVNLYLEYTGGQDVGVDLGDWLLWLFQKGLIKGFVRIELHELDAALDHFDVVVGGFVLTDDCDQKFTDGQPFDVSPTDQPDPSEGHAMLWLGVQSADGLAELCTWGGVASCTAAWRAACTQQLFAVLTVDESKAPFYAELAADLSALGGTVAPVDPTPTPEPVTPPPAPSTPPPAPMPPSDPTLLEEFRAEVRKWIADVEAFLTRVAS